MITFFLGLPGSGKTYQAVNRIYNNFSSDKEAIKDKKVTFKNCYTNINQFKFNKLNNTHNLDFEKLYKVLERLHGHYKAKKSDEYLLRFLELVKLKDTLIVIDEAHNFFDVQDKILVWWLSYHRHLHHEIILITQNLSLINAKYKAFSEFFYVAKPSSLRLFKSHFKYNIFTHSRLAKNSQAGNFKVKQNSKVFDLYHSGDSVDTKNIVLRYIIISIFIFLALITFFYFFIFSKSNSQVVVETKKTIVKNDSIKNDSIETIIKKDSLLDYSNLNLVELKCSNTLCSSKNFSLNRKVFLHYLKTENIKHIHSYYINLKTKVYYLEIGDEFLKFLQGARKNENYNKSDVSISDNFKPFGG